MDASKSFDPDGEVGSITYAWTCTPPVGIAGVTPCLDNNSVPLALAPSSSQLLALMGSPAGLNYSFTLVLTKDTRVSSTDLFLVVLSAVKLPVIRLQARAEDEARNG